jgi:hypothetical protein
MTRRPDPQLVLLEKRPTLPAWNTLPAECRNEVLRILVRMLRDVVAGAPRGAAEVGDE